MTLTSFLGVFLVMTTSAQSTAITQNQYDLITSNCTTLKATLNQLHSSDALLRVNVGQTYESILTKLMKRFNERVANNNLNGDDLEVVAADFEAKLNNFRNDYVVYERQLSLVIGIDCQLEPQTFYNNLSMAQAYRSKLHQDVLDLNQLMDKYSVTIDAFKASNQSIIERASNR